MITHFKDAANSDDVKKKLQLIQYFDLTSTDFKGIKQRLADKLGARQYKTGTTPYPKGSKYSYETSATDEYGWKLKIEEKKTDGTFENAVYRKLITSGADKLDPDWSLEALKEEVNALLWTAMKDKKEIKKGFDLTDTNANN